MFPATGSINCDAAPDTGSAVKIEEGATTGARAVFNDEMSVEQDRFDLREERVVAIEVCPAGLDHADVLGFFTVYKVRDGSAQKIGLGNKVGVKDGNEFAFSCLQPVFERTCLVAFAIGAMNVGDGHALRGVTIDAGFCDFAGFVGGVIEDLDVEKLARVIKAGNSFDEAFDHVALIENWKLDGDAGPFFDCWRRARNVLAVFVVIVDEPVSVEAVPREDDEDDEVGNHHREVEGIGVVYAREGAVGELVPITAHTTLREEDECIQKSHRRHR